MQYEQNKHPAGLSIIYWIQFKKKNQKTDVVK